MNQAKGLQNLAGLAVTALAATLMPAASNAFTVLSTSYDGNAAGDGFDTTSTGLYIVKPTASFSGNSFNGLFDGTASMIVKGGTFNGNGNDGLQVITDTSKFVTVNGGTFDHSLGGLDVYGARLTVNAGDFSGNAAYGLEAHSVSKVNGGSFMNNGNFGIATFDSTTSVYGGTFGGNLTGDFAAVSSAGIVHIYGTFDKYGTFTDSGTFTGTLAQGGVAQTFAYSTFSGGTIVLSNAAMLSAVPEPSTWLLLCAGLGLIALPKGLRAKAPTARVA